MDTPTSPPKPKRVTRTPEEMRNRILYFRVSQREVDDLYRYARARKATMSYMIREALHSTYPDIFGDVNRHIRKPKKPVPQDPPTQILRSLVDGNVKIVTMPKSDEV